MQEWLLEMLFLKCTGDMSIGFFYSYFPNICWIHLCKKDCYFSWTGTFVDCFVLIMMEFYL